MTGIHVTRLRRAAGKRERFVARLSDLTANGSTVTEAKAAVIELAGRLTVDLRAPSFLWFDPYLLVVWRELWGWAYKVVKPAEFAPDSSGRPKPVYGTSCGYETSDDAERHGRRHVAQLLFDFMRTTGTEAIVHGGDQQEHLRWCCWQLSYRRLIGEGRTREDALREARSDDPQVRLPA